MTAPVAVVAGEVHELHPLVRRVTCPNPGLMTGPGTNTYLVGRERVAVIDPGPDSQREHLERVVAAAGDIGWIICTHTHIDHSPAAPELAEMTGAPVLAFDSRDGLEPSIVLGDGDAVAGPEFTLRAVHTPGHASNHLCFMLEESSWLFSGDHVMQGSTVVITPPDGDMAAYLASLERLASLGAAAIAPAHGHVLVDPASVISDYLEHRSARESAIAAALSRLEEASVEELVSEVYTDVPEILHPVAQFSVWAHLRKLVAEGRAAGGPEMGDRYTTR